MKKTNFLAALFLLPVLLLAQPDFYDSYSFDRADTLRGSLRPERTNYDVTFYELHLTLDPRRRHLSGYVDMAFQVVGELPTLQVDLFENMDLERIEWNGRTLTFEREEDAVFVHFPSARPAGEQTSIRMHYSGNPTTARRPPWDGGFVWAKDERERDWVGVACEGDGASLWWPNKDHLSDEPDSVLISIAVPDPLIAVANGNLRSTEDEGRFTRYNWFVSYPINNYNVTLNIAHYAHWQEEYYAQDGDTLMLDYYVLDYNEDRAREHFQQTHGVLEAYEVYLGKYPFWKDGFCMVETPYLGMEHQSAIAYGNQYMRGYLGGMIPRGMDWDYIIVHETGHEYFGNSISCYDLAEMWIHESFTTYLEAVYVEHHYGYEDALRYLRGQRFTILNQEPIIGPKGVNWEDWSGSDHYMKGSWILHTLRHAIGDDELWWAIFKGFYQEHAISNVVSEDFFNYVNEKTGRDWTPFFDQYLRYPDIPTLEYRLAEKGDNLEVQYRWVADVEGFNMPILFGRPGDYVRAEATTDWQKMMLPNTTSREFQVADELFLVRKAKR